MPPDMSSAELPVICERCRTEIGAGALFCPMCGAPRTKRDGDPMIGEVVADRYLLRERLGHGGSGTIYLAEHVTLRRKVAVKILHHELSRDDLAVERFRREAVTVGEIDNEHIVEVHDFGRTRDGRLFLAMELLEGKTLADRIAEKRRLPIDQVVDVLIQAGEALMEAHAMGYVHRDLRPRNLFLTRRKGRDGFVKLLDFGLAKLVEAEGEAASTSLGMTFGDPRYMSPEQARGDAIDRRADLYSLGVIAYEMLTGQPPFVGKKVFDVLTQHMETTAPALSTQRPEIPAWLEAIVVRMLAKRPEDRFVTVYRLVEALREGQARGTIMTDAAAQSMPPVMPPPPAPRRRETGVVRVMSRDAIDEAAKQDGAAGEGGAARRDGAASPDEAPGRDEAAARDEAGGRAEVAKRGETEDAAAVDGSDRVRAASLPRKSSEMSGAWFADGEAEKSEPRPSGTERVFGSRAAIVDDEPAYAPEKRRWLPWAIGAAGVVVVGVILLVALPTGKKPTPRPDEALVAASPPDAAPPQPIVAAVDAAPPPIATKPVRPTNPVRRPVANPDSDPDENPFEAIRRMNLPDAGPAAPPKNDPAITEEQRAQAEFFVKLGHRALSDGDLKSAQTNFNKAREFDHRNADAIAGLGEVSLRLGLFEEAAVHLDAAARLKPGSPRIQILRGQAHLGAGDASSAAAAFKAALKADPDNEVARKGYQEAVRKGGE